MSDLSPRQWGKGDPEPAVTVDRVSDREGDPWWRSDDVWSCGADALAWSDLLKIWGPLTERRDEEPVSTASSPQDVSISSSVGGGDGETVTDELRALRDAIENLLVRFDAVDSKRIIADEIVNSVLAGWRPPQTDDSAWMRRCPSMAPESHLIPEARQCQLVDGHVQAHTWCGEAGEFSSWFKSWSRATPSPHTEGVNP